MVQKLNSHDSPGSQDYHCMSSESFYNHYTTLYKKQLFSEHKQQSKQLNMEMISAISSLFLSKFVSFFAIF